MDKLIELLNEYSELKEERLTGEEGQPIRKRHDYELEYPIEKIRIISKQYGFIKWLVENKKIDLENLIIKRVEDRGGNKVIKDIKYYSEVESLLMILSIQDNPIEFLVSVLK